MTRDQQAVMAEMTLEQGMSIRSRLLSELDELEESFKRMRETVETLPTDAGVSVPLPDSDRTVEVKVRRKWPHLWNK